MRIWFCRLQLQAFACTVILRSESSGTRDHILLPQIRDSPNLKDQVLSIYIPIGKGVAQLYSQVLGSIFIASYGSKGYDGGIRPRLHTGID
jgi:hypothetical protein